EANGRSDPRDRDCGQHSGDDDVEKIVTGIEGGNPDDQNYDDVETANARDFEVESVSDPFGFNPACQIGNGCQPNPGRQQQRQRCQNDGSGNVAGLAHRGRENSSSERQGKAERSGNKAQPRAQPDPPSNSEQAFGAVEPGRFERQFSQTSLKPSTDAAECQVTSRADPVGEFSARKRCRGGRKELGPSSYGMCPSPGSVTTSVCFILEANTCADAISTTRSFSPHTIRVGISGRLSIAFFSSSISPRQV